MGLAISEDDLSVYRHREEWQPEGECSNLPPNVDPDVFFPGKGRPSKSPAYMKYCGACPVMIECMNWGIVHQPFGVWGGLTQAERERLPIELRNHLTKEARSQGWFEADAMPAPMPLSAIPSQSRFAPEELDDDDLFAFDFELVVAESRQEPQASQLAEVAHPIAS